MSHPVPLDTVTLNRSGSGFTVAPFDLSIVVQLAMVRHKLHVDLRKGCHVARERELLVEYDRIFKQDVNGRSIPQPWIPVGLAPAVEYLLRGKGAEVRQTGMWPSPLAAPFLENIRPHGFIDAQVLDLVQHHDRGLIRYGAGVDPAWVIGQIALAYPDLSIVVAAATKKAVYSLTDRLKRWLTSDVVAVTGGRDNSRRTRIAVATFKGVYKFGVGLAQRHVMIAADAMQVLGTEGKRCLVAAFRCRQYGLLPANATVAPLDEDEQRALFGFEEVIVAPHGHQQPQVEVVWIPNGGGPSRFKEAERAITGAAHLGPNGALSTAPAARGASPVLDDKGIELLDSMRDDFWHQPIRNRQIRRLAIGLHSGGHEQLQRDFPCVASILQGGPPLRLAILVESIEHAIALAERLPTFAVVAAKDVHLHGLSKKKQAVFLRATAMDWGTCPCIITGGGADCVQLAWFDVVINATGSASAPLALAGLIQSGGVPREQRVTGFRTSSVDSGAPTCPPPPPVAMSQKVVLIDFADRSSPTLRKALRRRRKAYKAAGWYAPGEDPVEERVKAWLAKRPRIKT